MKNYASIIKKIILPLLILSFTGCAGMPEMRNKPSMIDHSNYESFDGIWDTPWGRVVFRQQGNKITGFYPHDKGKISGLVENNTLKGTWSESPSYSPPKDAGDLEFILSSDKRSWLGRWRYGSSGEWKPDWSGTLVTK